MYSFKKSAFLLSTAFVLYNNVYAAGKSLDDMADEFWKTQSGSHLHKHYAHLKPEAATKRGIKDFVNRHRSEIEKQSASAGVCLFDYTKEDEEVHKLFAQVEPLLKKEVRYRKTHVFAYTGYSASIAQFNTCLDEGNAVLSANENVGNPLHYKTPEQNKIKNRDQFLKGYWNGYKEHIDQRNKNGEKIKLLDPKRRSGFGKAPDGSEFSRTHSKCTNISLFGNFRRGDPYECTLFFYITAGNVGQFNDSLTTNYLKSVGIISENATQAEIDAKLAPYKQIHAEKMAKGGGGLMQFKIANEHADQNLFFSYAKGIPCYINPKTGKIIDKGRDKPLPYIGSGTKTRQIPSVVKGIDLYKKNSKKFEKQFDNDMGNVQLRMVVNPKVCANKSVIETTTTTRYAVPQADVKETEAKVHAQFSNDLVEAVSKDQISKACSRTSAFGQLKDIILGKGRISDLPKLLMRASKQGFAEACAILKKATAPLAGTDKDVASRMGVMERLSNEFEKYQQMCKKGAHKAIEAIKQLF